FFFWREGGSERGTSPRVTHHLRTGHIGQWGARGTHTVAPSSIMPWLKSPGLEFASSACACCQVWAVVRLMPIDLLPINLCKIRSTFPSTTATGSENAMLAMAAAV